MQCAPTRRESRPRSQPARCLVALVALSALLLAGCSGSPSATSTQDRSGLDASPAEVAPGAQGGAPAAGAPSASGKQGIPGKPAGGAKSRAPAVGVAPKLTKNASLDLRVTNIERAAGKVRAVASGLQAQVVSEQIGKGAGDPVPLQGGDSKQSPSGTSGEPGVSDGPGVSGGPGDVGGFGSLTLSVPSDKLDTALDQLARIGTVHGRNASSQDVTAQFVDTQSRLKTMRASVGRVRALMAQAKDIGQVVALESELSQREADLESLESQVAALTNNVERSTVTVSLSTPGSLPVSETGFAAGLRSGWDAFTASARGLLTAIGAILPFVVLLALVGAPIVWWLRRRRTRAQSQVNAP